MHADFQVDDYHGYWVLVISYIGANFFGGFLGQNDHAQNTPIPRPWHAYLIDFAFPSIDRVREYLIYICACRVRDLSEIKG